MRITRQTALLFLNSCTMWALPLWTSPWTIKMWLLHKIDCSPDRSPIPKLHQNITNTPHWASQRWPTWSTSEIAQRCAYQLAYPKILLPVVLLWCECDVKSQLFSPTETRPCFFAQWVPRTWHSLGGPHQLSIPYAHLCAFGSSWAFHPEKSYLERGRTL